MDFKVLGKNIRKYRRLAEITQEQLAEFCDCSHSHLGAIEQGKVNVSVELLVKIANVLRVTADQLLTTNYVAPELSLLKEIEERVKRLSTVQKIEICDLFNTILDKFDNCSGTK